MVLHNSKWDRKATRRYLKKHGLNGKKAEGEEGQEPKDELDLSDDDKVDEEKDTSDNSDSNSDSDSDAWKRKPLQSNSWRYQKKSTEDQLNELLAESAALASQNGEENSIAQTALKKRIDEIRSKAEHQENNPDFFPDEEENAEYDEDYSNLIRNAALKADTRPIESPDHIQVHDNPEEFQQLQKDIDHSKLVTNIKKRFGSRNNKPSLIQEDDFDTFLKDVDKLQLEGNGDEHDFVSEFKNEESQKDSIDKQKEDYLDFLLS